MYPGSASRIKMDELYITRPEEFEREGVLLDSTERSDEPGILEAYKDWLPEALQSEPRAVIVDPVVYPRFRNRWEHTY